MDKGFRLTLRTALALCILAGVGLVIYSFASPGPTHRSSTNALSVPGSGAGQVSPGPSGAQGAESTATGAEGGPARSAAAGKTGGSDIQLSFWQHIFFDQKTQRKEGEIQGAKAFLKGDTAVDIIAPKLIVYMFPKEAQEPQDLDVQVGSVRVTAKKGSVDKEKGLVRLSDEVKAEGKDFEVRADDVLYSFADRTLRSDGHVEIERFNTEAEGARAPAMTLSGEGLTVDMTLQKMKVLSGAVAHIYGVSTEFLASGPQAGSPTLEPTDVVITSEGPMLYEHLARKVTFTQNVKVLYGGRTLTCDELTVQLAAGGGNGPPKVSDIFAQGNVTLSFADQVARGQNLEWHSVTLTGTLVGDPCEVVSSEFRLTGERLNFYRMNTRFDAKGPGQLFWGKELSAPDAQPPEPANAVHRAGPLNLNKSAPVTISWETSMSYDVNARYAVFAGGVVAEQTNSSLTCDQLKLNFRPDTSDIDSVVATGSVSIHDPSATTGQDVACQELTWDAQADTIELTAAKGQSVSITNAGKGRQKISSPHVIFDNAHGILESPAPGQLTLEPSQNPADAATAGQPVAVEWQESMRFVQRPEPVATFSGSVVAQRADESMKADRLRIDFDADMNPLKITAQGGTVIDVRSAQVLPAGPLAGAPGAAEKPDAGPDNHWRLAGDSITIEPPEQAIWSAMPGTLSVVEGGRTAGTIAWQKQMRLDSAQSTAQFQGTVAADVTGGALKCDDLTVRFDETRHLRHARAEGNVEFDATGENPWKLKSAVADAVFAGANVLRQIIARGDDTNKIEVSDEGRTLQARRLTLFLDAVEGQDHPAISRAIAEEDVSVTYNQEPVIQGLGDRLEWDRATDAYTLTGEPRARVRRGTWVTQSARIILNRATGNILGNSDQSP